MLQAHPESARNKTVRMAGADSVVGEKMESRAEYQRWGKSEGLVAQHFGIYSK